MPTLDAPPTPDFQGPDLLQRDRGGTLTCPLYDGVDLVAPTSGTLTLSTKGGTVLLSAVAATISGSVAQYAVTTATTFADGTTLADQALEMGYRVEWKLTVSGTAYTYRNVGGIVRAVPAPAATHMDLVRSYSDLERALTGLDQDDYGPQLAEAWRQLTRWLIRQGSRPHLVLDGWELKELHRAWAYKLIVELLAEGSPEGSIWYDRKVDAREELAEAKKVEFTYDHNDDGIADTHRRPAQPVTILTSTAGRRGYDPCGWDWC